MSKKTSIIKKYKKHWIWLDTLLSAAKTEFMALFSAIAKTLKALENNNKINEKQIHDLIFLLHALCSLLSELELENNKKSLIMNRQTVISKLL